MILDPQFDFVLLDELNIALRNDYLDIAEVVAFLEQRPRDKHICITGRDARRALAGNRRPRHRDDAGRSIRTRPATRRSVESSFETPARCCVCASRCSLRDESRTHARSAPARIVSLNQCLDAILVELVPHERIAAISHYSRDPLRSTIAALAQRLPITYEIGRRNRRAAARPGADQPPLRDRRRATPCDASAFATNCSTSRSPCRTVSRRSAGSQRWSATLRPAKRWSREIEQRHRRSTPCRRARADSPPRSTNRRTDRRREHRHGRSDADRRARQSRRALRHPNTSAAAAGTARRGAARSAAGRRS